MILGTGIDLVSVERFSSWASIPMLQLKKIFSEEEINYCLKVPRLSAQRFAVRFAVREAFFKALSVWQKTVRHPLLKVCKSVKLVHSENQAPVIHINWTMLGVEKNHGSLVVHCSLTHTADSALAMVIIEKL